MELLNNTVDLHNANLSSSGGLIPLVCPRREPQPKSKQDVIDLILGDPSYCAYCILYLYNNQEKDEKLSHMTIHRNGIGFNALDAGIFTPMAEQILACHSLSAEDLAICRDLKTGTPRLAKYWRQLLSASTEGIQ